MSKGKKASQDFSQGTRAVRWIRKDSRRREAQSWRRSDPMGRRQPVPEDAGQDRGSLGGVCQANKRRRQGSLLDLAKPRGDADVGWENGLLGGKRKGHQISSAPELRKVALAPQASPRRTAPPGGGVQAKVRASSRGCTQTQSQPNLPSVTLGKLPDLWAPASSSGKWGSTWSYLRARVLGPEPVLRTQLSLWVSSKEEE